MVVGERQKNLGGGKYETQYEVKWKGYEKKHNTYEPLSNLAGCEDMVAEYKERKRQRDAELEAEEREKKRQKQEDADAERKRLAAAEAAARVASRQQGAEGAEGAPAVATDATDASGTSAPGPDKKTRRSAPCWEVFTETGAKDGYAFCTLTHPKKISQLCNEEICTARDRHGPRLVEVLEAEGDDVAQAGQDGQAVPRRTVLIGRCRARLLGCRKDAR